MKICSEAAKEQDFSKVKFGDGFIRPRIELNRSRTLPAILRNCRETGRIEAWRWKEGMPNRPHIFWDSDVAKWIEAEAFRLANGPCPEAEKAVDEAVDLMEKAQRNDGYLNSFYINVEPGKRWTNLRDCHELYCAGHLIEGAVAYFQATGKRKMLDVMCRYADHIAKTFGPGRGQKRGYCGHEEIELALVKLYRATGEKKYLDLAKYFVDERGRLPHYFDIEAEARGEKRRADSPGSYFYYQAHEPVREQKEAVGHSVRAMYLYSAMADVARETGDRELLDACRRLWEDTVTKKMYVTGGIGSTKEGERFTFAYDLPNETAYAETCANIGLVFFSHRMLLVEKDARYADVMERAFYNSVLSGIGLDGESFFYANPLAVGPDDGQEKPGHVAPARSKWFGCSCCPPNVARIIESFGRYMYMTFKDMAYVNLYARSEAELDIGGKKASIIQRTDYPWDGLVKIEFVMEKAMEFTLALRIPGWTDGSAKLKINGKNVPLNIRKGYAEIERKWFCGDKIELDLPMDVQVVEPHPSVRMNCGMAALQRGPLVYCLEEIDNGKELSSILLPENPGLKAVFKRKLLGGCAVIEGKALRLDKKGWGGTLYRPCGRTKLKKIRFKAVPYCLWGNRGKGEMAVWIRRRTV